MDKKGERFGTDDIQTENDKLFHSIGLDDIKEIAQRSRVTILAGRESKAELLHGLLKKGYANSIIIETSTANKLLALGSQQTST